MRSILEAWATTTRTRSTPPARPELDVARARQVTDGLRAAMDDVRRTVAVLAAAVRDAHGARVWVPLGYSGWGTYCSAELGISRAQAYRLLDAAHALAAIDGAVATGSEVSHARDTGPAGAAVLDYGLSLRALVAVWRPQRRRRRADHLPPGRARPQRCTRP